MKDKFKPYTKDLQLESWWYILKYDDGDIVYAWYDSETNEFIIDYDRYGVDSIYTLDAPSYYMLHEE